MQPLIISKHRLTTDELKDNKMVLYRYVRGSHAYGTNIDTSDIDIGGVYCADLERLIGTRLYYDTQVQDATHDTVYYELEKYICLLGQSNPNILESLFVDEDCIQYMHPAFKLLRENRNMFLTKQCFQSFGGYAISQIKKARGLNKKVTMIKPEHKTPLDFCFCKYKQGSTNIQNWMSYRNLKQEYVGCVNMPNMGEMIALYYDWKRFFEDHSEIDWRSYYMKEITSYHGDTQKDLVSEMKSRKANGDWSEEDEAVFQFRMNECRWCAFIRFLVKQYNLPTYGDFLKWKDEQCAIERNYKGMLKLLPDGGYGDCFRMSSVIVDDEPICEIYYNMNGYSEHCKQFKEYNEWEEKRNPVRYKENCKENYDSKNMMHAFRLLTMAIEVAEGKGFNCNRRNIDRDFLLAIRRHEFTYTELITKLEELKERFDEACKTSELPDNIDPTLMNELCIKIRYAFWDSVQES